MKSNLWISVILPSTGEGEAVDLEVEYDPGTLGFQDEIPEPDEVHVLSGVDVDSLTDEDWEMIGEVAAVAYDADQIRCWDDEPDVDESMYDPYMGQDFDPDFYDLD